MGKVYAGERLGSRCAVTVDGRELPIRLDLRDYSYSGFEWDGDEQGAAQLALAILADYYGPWGLEQVALSLAEDFRQLVIAWLPYEKWRLEERDVAAAVRAIVRERGAGQEAEGPWVYAP
jgi:hypothetical protein